MAASAEVKILDNPRKVCKAVAREIRNLTRGSVKPRFDIALSGGKTPKKLFEILVERHKDTIPWERIHFWWGDERCVSPDSDESNFKMANDFLFTRLKIPAKNIHRIKGEDNPQEEALRYSDELNRNLPRRGDVPVFDVVLLGMGSDGHTASIFPDRMDLFNEERNCVVTKHPLTGQNRITLTGRVLKNATRVFFMVTGEDKSERVSEIMNNEESARLLPAYSIEPINGALIWFIDEAAASKIT